MSRLFNELRVSNDRDTDILYVQFIDLRRIMMGHG